MKPSAYSASIAFARTFLNVEAADPNLFIAEQDPETISNQLQFAEKLFPDKAVMLCPISHTNAKYFSSNCDHILGYPNQALLQFDVKDFFLLIHPDDVSSVQLCYQFIKDLGPYNPENHRFIMNYRFRKKTGEYIHIQNEHISVTVEGKRFLFLLLFTDLTEREKFYHVKLDVLKRIKDVFVKTYTYNPKQANKLITPRQHDIARLVMKGYSNQQIADQLRVSIYTVKNHKQMLFKKANVKNNVELANYVKSLQT